MKEIDVDKARLVIFMLHNYGVRNYAELVWDLLDNYLKQVAQDTQPPVPQAGNGLTEPERVVVSAEEPVPTPVPRCARAYSNWSECERKASGRVGSVHLCYPHGQKLSAQYNTPFILYKSEVPEGDLGCEIHTVTSGSPCTFRPIGYLRRTGQADLHLCNFHSKHPVAMKPAFTLYAAE